MVPINLWEHQSAIKALYSKCVGQTCLEHKITRMELDILLFLANNPGFDTATDIVEIRYLAKSQVSSSLRLLEERGYIRKEYARGNRKTAHLKVCDKASAVIADGREAQTKFLNVMLQGFTREDVRCMKQYTDRIFGNIDRYLKEEVE